MEKEKLGTIRHSITQGRVRREAGVVKTKLGFPQKKTREEKSLPLEIFFAKLRIIQ